MSKSALLFAAAAFALGVGVAWAQQPPHPHTGPGGHPQGQRPMHAPPPRGPMHPQGGLVFHHRPVFHSGPVTGLAVHDADMWRHGQWRHEHRFGRLGWWYWYPEPVYPYPTYVTTTYYEDNGAGSYWYCEDPKGYWPYVRECHSGWQAVPTAPPDAQPRPDSPPPPSY